MSKPKKPPVKDTDYRYRGSQTTGHGTGIGDVFDPHGQSDRGHRVEDERAGLLTCRKCGEEVTHQEKDNGKWSVRNLDGSAHRRTCGKS